MVEEEEAEAFSMVEEGQTGTSEVEAEGRDPEDDASSIEGSSSGFVFFVLFFFSGAGGSVDEDPKDSVGAGSLEVGS